MNKLLRNSLDEILAEPMNVSVTKGTVSGNSIEVLFIREQCFESFLYKDDSVSRDKDLVELINRLKEKQNEKHEKG